MRLALFVRGQFDGFLTFVIGLQLDQSAFLGADRPGPHAVGLTPWQSARSAWCSSAGAADATPASNRRRRPALPFGLRHLCRCLRFWTSVRRAEVFVEPRASVVDMLFRGMAFVQTAPSDMPETPTALPMLRVARVIAATLLAAVVPSLVAWGLRADGVLKSPVVAVAVAVAVSLGLCYGASCWWQRCRGSRDVLFGDLMIWGWVRRCRVERRVASAVLLLGLPPTQRRDSALTLSVEQRTRLLHQLATDLETSDPYTHGHSRRVARYASSIASRMGLAEHEVAKVRAAAALHDVGKLNTPRHILHKQGRLTEVEFAAIRRHATDGARMIRALAGDDELTSIVLHHHERLDGTGYPSRLSGEEIPLAARIIAVADTFDAITSARPYRPAKPHKAALDILRAEAGTQLDPEAVHAFCSLYFSRRPLAIFVAASNAAEGLIPGIIARISAAARVYGTAAGVAALGTGTLALPVAGGSDGRGAPPIPAAAPPDRAAGRGSVDAASTRSIASTR